jgi:hypothetical protein
MALQKLFESSYWTDINKKAIEAVLEDRKRFIGMTNYLTKVATHYDGVEIIPLKTSKTDTYTKSFVSSDPERLAAILAIRINTNGISHSVQATETEYKVSWMERYICSVFLSREHITPYDSVFIQLEEIAHALYSLQPEHIAMRDELVDSFERQMKKIHKFYKSNTVQLNQNTIRFDQTLPPDILEFVKEHCLFVQNPMDDSKFLPIFISSEKNILASMVKNHAHSVSQIQSIHDYRMQGYEIHLLETDIIFYVFNFSVYDVIPYFDDGVYRYASKWVTLRILCLMYKYFPNVQEIIESVFEETDEIVDYSGQYIDKACSIYPGKQKINTIVYLPEKIRREKGYYVLPDSTEPFEIHSSLSRSSISAMSSLSESSDSLSESPPAGSSGGAMEVSINGGYLSLRGVETGSSGITNSFFASA